MKLFVYGTLLGGAPQGALLAGRHRAKASVRGTLYALPAGYPALVLRGEGEVHGELIEGLDARLMALLDQYEGVAEGLYQRVQLDVDVGLHRERAWAYVMRAPERRGGREIPDGRWRSVIRR